MSPSRADALPSTPLSFRPIRPEDDAAVASLIRTVMPEFGAGGAGFAIHDPEVDRMSAAFGGPRTRYCVVVDGPGRVVGGGGVAPLKGGAQDVCELQKMYFLREARGRGVGKALLAHLLAEARALGFRTCYLETLTTMEAAQGLYRHMGFAPLPGPLGSTGHFGCDRWYALPL
jgi:putative acetyltransferase